MMKKFKRVLCFALAFALAIPMVGSALAAGPVDEEPAALTIEDVAAQVRAANPNSEVIVENGVIHVCVNPEDAAVRRAPMRSAASIQASEQTIYAPEGGMWTTFTQPWYTFANPESYVIPYAVYFLPATNANVLHEALTSTELMDYVLNTSLKNQGEAAIQAALKVKFGLSFSYADIAYLYSAACRDLYVLVNKVSYANALNSSTTGKVRIDCATQSTFPVNYYYAWNSDYVTNSPWQDYNPVFHQGVYSL